MQPLLRGRVLTEARAALAELSARFLLLRPSAVRDVSLADGLSGVVLAHAALDPVFPGAGHAARAEHALHRAIDRLGREHVDPGLHLGLAGLGWVAAHVMDPAEEAPIQDHLFAAIDGALTQVISRPPAMDRFDAVYGLAGIGVYALERLPSPSAKALLALVVERLATTAQPQAPGVAWRSDPAWISCDPRVARPRDQEWGLGVAHGTAGVIALLGRAAVAEVDDRTRQTARTLVEQAVAWLLAQANPRGAPSAFPHHGNAPTAARGPTRIAWCSGDLGIAAALLVAARATRTRAWQRAAISIALRAAARPFARAGAVDAGLCHGAAGVAHVFHRLFRTTGDERFATAARRWFARALAMRTPGAGFAGFRALDPDRRHRLGWRSPPGFLTGGAGVALALIAATTATEPAWDRALMLS
ncbi:MAG: hypothetical protein K8W52_10345 [Deltaproteobacteria bacterium]|nr:hypothetical protein [Deltaproteobacteria bacterium]